MSLFGTSNPDKLASLINTPGGGSTAATSLKSKRDKYMTEIRRDQRNQIINKKRMQPNALKMLGQNISDEAGSEEDSKYSFSHLQNHPQRAILIGKIKEFLKLEAHEASFEEICALLKNGDL